MDGTGAGVVCPRLAGSNDCPPPCHTKEDEEEEGGEEDGGERVGEVQSMAYKEGEKTERMGEGRRPPPLVVVGR